MKRGFILAVLCGLLSGLSGCALLGAGYLGGVAVKEHGQVSDKQECIQKGGVWVKGSSWVFKSGKCELSSKAGREE